MPKRKEHKGSIEEEEDRDRARLGLLVMEGEVVSPDRRGIQQRERESSHTFHYQTFPVPS
jgi:hypothetical protein